jgi:hypothetical protein
MHRSFAILVGCFAGCIPAASLAQVHRSAEVIIAPVGSDGFRSASRLAQATTFSMFPSVLSSTRSPYGTGPQLLETSSSCVLLPEGTIVPDCDITITWEAENGSGGHVHNTNRPPGIFTTSNGVSSGSTSPGPPGSLTDNSGQSGTIGLTYTSPEASGITDLTVIGVAVVNGSTVHFGPGVYTIGIGIDGIQLASATGFNVSTSSNMHGSNNGNATPVTITAMGITGQRFIDLLTQQQLPIRPIRATAISLPQGGLFDFRNEWRPPHVGHRFGDEIDIGIREFTQAQRQLLRIAIRDGGFDMPVPNESPSDPNADHWHLRLRQ